MSGSFGGADFGAVPPLLGPEIIVNTGSTIVEPNDTTLVATVVAGIEMGGTIGPAATVTFTGDSAITEANPTVGPGVLIDAAIGGQTTAEQSVLNAMGYFVNAGTIAADGPAGSVFTIDVGGFFDNAGTLAVSAGNTMDVTLGIGASLTGTGPVQVAAGGTMAINSGRLYGTVANDGVIRAVGDGPPGQTDTVLIFNPLTGAGTVDIGPNAILELYQPGTQTVQFPTSGAGELILPGLSPITTPLLGLNTGDKIEFILDPPITGVSVSGSTITIATTSGNSVLTDVSFAAGANQSFHSFLDSTTGDWAIQVNAPSDTWTSFGGTSDLGTAGNWSAGVPTGADALNFNGGGQTLTGTASGLSAEFGALAGEWTLNGATLTLAGEPNPPYDPFALTFDSNVLPNGATVTASGTSSFGSGVMVTAQGGSSVRTEGDTIAQSAGQIASLILSGAGTTWTEAADAADAGNGYGTGYLNVGYSGTGFLSVTNSAALSTGFYAIIGENAGGFGSATVSGGGRWSTAGNFIDGDDGDGAATITAGGTLSFGGTFAAVGDQAGSSGRLVIGPGGVLRDTRTALASDNFFSLNIGGHGASGTLGPATGAMQVDGPGALLDLNGNALSVGNSGGQGSLVISNGGTVRAGTPDDNNLVALGIGKSGQGEVVVTGAGSALLLAGGAFDGRGGTGNLVVENGGSLNVGIDPLDSSGGLGIGNGTSASNSFVGGSGSATVTGGGRVTIAHGLGVGGFGVNGVLNVSNGGSVEVGTSMGVGRGGIVAGTVEVGTGLVNIGAGGTLQIDGTGIASGFSALGAGNYAGAIGQINVLGAGALLNVLGANHIRAPRRIRFSDAT